MPRYSERELYAKALLCYDSNNAPLVFDEFAADVNRVVCLAKLIKQQKIKDEPQNIRLLLNWCIVTFNVFGLDAANLLFSVSDEFIYPEIISFLVILNKYPKNGVCILVDDSVIHLEDFEENLTFTDEIRQAIK